MAKRDARKFTAGKSPTFQDRIALEVCELLDVAVANVGMSLGNWQPISIATLNPEQKKQAA
ncbi:toxin-antitoxin system HicB family antitoxin [Pectobacterium brasiliense]|nr:toxin-antitoxin system HicB family antitoxin [Pectobacterium brasiliense]WGL30224.1 toxin-antitoxin system HicB family antitoxin [Pectobacterium brasiliense]